ncbi:MAG TPA: MFS transporter [Bacillota bacterium]|nr:MFS transporter [Bacillota bacterium]
MGQSQAEAGTADAHYQRIALVVVMMGVMIAAVDTTIVVLALPVMMGDLHTDLVTMVWVIMAYLLVMTVLTTQVGRFGDMYGRVRMYNLGFAVFTLGSVACGFASTGVALIAFRVAQALGGALISSNSGAIIADTFPAHARGRAYGMTSIGYNTGAVLGILLGGLIITFVNWRYIFFINLPIGVTALIMGVRVLRERSPRLARKIDFPGVALLGAGLLLLLIGLTNATGAGFTRTVVEMVVGGALVVVGFLAWERFAPAPLLDLRLLRRRVLTASVFAASLQALGNFAILFLIIMYLQGVRGLSPFIASLLLVPGYVVGGFIGPWSGRLADRLGARVPASLGLLVQVAGVLVYTTLGVATPLWVVVVAATINGIGSGFFFPANSSAVMADAPPRDYGVASGLLRTLSNVGMVTSFAVALLIASTAIPRQAAFAIFVGTTRLSAALASAFVHGLHAALGGSIVFLVLALVLSLLRGRESRGTTAP